MELPERGWDERLRASQPGKKEHQMLVVGYALGMEGFVMKEEDSRWFSGEPSRELQRKEEEEETTHSVCTRQIMDDANRLKCSRYQQKR